MIDSAEVTRMPAARPPFLKWAGGKRWLANRPELLIPDVYDRYVEPFFGGGALFFHLRPKEALLADVNDKLIATYRAVRDDWPRVEAALAVHASQHCKAYYYSVRSLVLTDPISAAAQFIYLNRTCWNGLYRVNRGGQFNVPIGTKTKVLLDGELQSVSEALATVTLAAGDFENTMAGICKGDFAYVDPPYTVKHNNNGFLKYNENIFTWDDQVRLRDIVKTAVSRGAKVLVSNASHESVRDLYAGVGELIELQRASVIAGKPTARGLETELLVRCY